MADGFGLSFARVRCVSDRQFESSIPVHVSILRRLLPESLKAISCDTPAVDCRVCKKSRTCAYSVIFVPRIDDETAGMKFIEDAAMPMAIKPRPSGTGMDLDITLAGDAAGTFNALVEAVRQVGLAGYGREHLRFKVSGVIPLDTKYAPAGGEQAAGAGARMPQIPVFDLDALVGEISAPDRRKAVLRFITPTMISQGSPSRRPEFGMFTRRLRDRLKIVAATHCGCRLPFDLHGMSSKAGDVTLLPQAGRADDAASYFGLLGDFVPLLRLGTHLHVGKFCAFGQGWYQIAG